MRTRQYCLGLSGQALQAALDAFPGGDRTADDEDGVVATDGTEYVAPRLAIEGSSDRLGAARDGSEHQHLANAVDAQKKLRQQRVERGSALLDITVSYGIAGTLGCWHARQSQLPQVAR